ncbi:hypothetical protein ACFWBX_36685, partial [Streptomyces sp. NPDC059991]
MPQRADRFAQIRAAGSGQQGACGAFPGHRHGPARGRPHRPGVLQEPLPYAGFAGAHRLQLQEP